MNPDRPITPEETQDIVNLILAPLRSYNFSIYYGLTRSEQDLQQLRNTLDSEDPENVLHELKYIIRNGPNFNSRKFEGIAPDIIEGAEEYIRNKRQRDAVHVQQMMATTPGLNQIPANVGPTIAHFVTGAYVPPTTGGAMKKKKRGAKKTRRMKRRGRKTLRK
jgi:hypothetical protein